MALALAGAGYAAISLAHPRAASCGLDVRASVNQKQRVHKVLNRPGCRAICDAA